MARVVVIPESTDNVAAMALLIRVVQATGAAVIMSHCLHYRTKDQEDGTVSVCSDCGAIGPGPNAGAARTNALLDCPHGADGRVCEAGCLCDCHHRVRKDVVEQKVVDACNDHPLGDYPLGCPLNSHLLGLCEHPNKEGSKDGTIVVCADCGRDLSPPRPIRPAEGSETQPEPTVDSPTDPPSE